jgi:hypothetical protein
MLRKQENLIWGGFVLLGIGWFLSRNPNCKRGCQTVAQHLASHGLDDIIGDLFGA